MADHQRIHPADLEAGNRPTAPLVPGGSFRSDKGDLAQRAKQQGYVPGPLPLPPRRVAPPAPLPPPKRRGRGCCCRFLCCAVVTAAVLAVLAAAAAGALYLALDPKAPRYSVDRLSVSAFQVDPATLAARAGFDVAVTATNPNSRIGIHYEPGSSLGVWYQSYRLARGALPAFYQGHRNTTVLALAMAGEVQLGSAAVVSGTGKNFSAKNFRENRKSCLSSSPAPPGFQPAAAAPPSFTAPPCAAVLLHLFFTCSSSLCGCAAARLH